MSDLGDLIPPGPPWVRGHVLRVPGDVVCVPIEDRGDGWWRAVVVGGTHPIYSVGGHDIHLSPQDIERAERIEL